jgi:hypothetical protein
MKDGNHKAKFRYLKLHNGQVHVLIYDCCLKAQAAKMIAQARRPLFRFCIVQQAPLQET